jgi:hypothetical protein
MEASTSTGRGSRPCSNPHLICSIHTAVVQIMATFMIRIPPHVLYIYAECIYSFLCGVQPKRNGKLLTTFQGRNVVPDLQFLKSPFYR